MGKDGEHRGGPSHNPKDTPEHESHRKAQSRDELKERSVKGDRPGRGERNGSAKKK